MKTPYLVYCVHPVYRVYYPVVSNVVSSVASSVVSSVASSCHTPCWKTIDHKSSLDDTRASSFARIILRSVWSAEAPEERRLRDAWGRTFKKWLLRRDSSVEAPAGSLKSQALRRISALSHHIALFTSTTQTSSFFSLSSRLSNWIRDSQSSEVLHLA